MGYLELGSVSAPTVVACGGVLHTRLLTVSSVVLFPIGERRTATFFGLVGALRRGASVVVAAGGTPAR